MLIDNENTNIDSKLSSQVTCIVCPIGCSLDVKVDGENISVTGNKCLRGEVYAQEEVRAPKRVVTATVDIEGASDAIRRVPVKTTSPCPKEKIPALLKDIYKAKVTLPVQVGDIIISNWSNLGIDVASTRNLK